MSIVRRSVVSGGRIARVELVRGTRTPEAGGVRNTVEGVSMHPVSTIGGSTATAVTVEVERTLAETSATLTSLDSEPLAAGTHGILLLCIDSEGTPPAAGQPPVDGVFVAPLYLTSPTAFQTTPPPGTPTPTPTPSPTPTQSSTPTPTPAVVPVANTTATGGTAAGTTASAGGGTLAVTGAPIALLGMLGAGVAALGGALILAGRRPGTPNRLSAPDDIRITHHHRETPT